MKTWSITFWVNEPEYGATVKILATSVNQLDYNAVSADGVRIQFDEAITEITHD